jgi:hypothetical protein
MFFCFQDVFLCDFEIKMILYFLSGIAVITSLSLTPRQAVPFLTSMKAAFALEQMLLKNRKGCRPLTLHLGVPTPVTNKFRSALLLALRRQGTETRCGSNISALSPQRLFPAVNKRCGSLRALSHLVRGIRDLRGACAAIT